MEGAAGQTFTGRVLDERSEEPVTTALVRLVDGEGAQLAVSIADSAGVYRVDVPGPGVYRLEAARIGFENFETPLLEVTNPDAEYPVDLLLRADPVELPGFTVMTDRASAEQVERQVRLMTGLSPASLRFEPLGFGEIQGHIDRAHNLDDVMRWEYAPGVLVRYTTDGPCYVYRSRGCLPVYLNGFRLNGDFMPEVPLDMLFTIVVLTPTDGSIAYPSGAVLLYTEAWIR